MDCTSTKCIIGYYLLVISVDKELECWLSSKIAGGDLSSCRINIRYLVHMEE